MKKSIEMEIILKDSTTVLAEGFRPGGIVKQVVSFNIPDEIFDRATFIQELYRRGEEFIKDNIEVKFKEVEDDRED